MEVHSCFYMLCTKIIKIWSFVETYLARIHLNLLNKCHSIVILYIMCHINHSYLSRTSTVHMIWLDGLGYETHLHLIKHCYGYVMKIWLLYLTVVYTCAYIIAMIHILLFHFLFLHVKIWISCTKAWEMYFDSFWLFQRS